jgi:hypothetical protein
MSSTVFIRHTCDRCGKVEEREHVKDTPSMSLGWEIVTLSKDFNDPPLLCPDCMQALKDWLTKTPDTVHH